MSSQRGRKSRDGLLLLLCIDMLSFLTTYLVQTKVVCNVCRQRGWFLSLGVIRISSSLRIARLRMSLLSWKMAAACAGGATDYSHFQWRPQSHWLRTGRCAAELVTSRDPLQSTEMERLNWFGVERGAARLLRVSCTSRSRTGRATSCGLHMQVVVRHAGRSAEALLQLPAPPVRDSTEGAPALWLTVGVLAADGFALQLRLKKADKVGPLKYLGE